MGRDRERNTTLSVIFSGGGGGAHREFNKNYCEQIAMESKMPEKNEGGRLS